MMIWRNTEPRVKQRNAANTTMMEPFSCRGWQSPDTMQSVPDSLRTMLNLSDTIDFKVLTIPSHQEHPFSLFSMTKNIPVLIFVEAAQALLTRLITCYHFHSATSQRKWSLRQTCCMFCNDCLRYSQVDVKWRQLIGHISVGWFACRAKPDYLV
jgi:hypothetical protein